MLHLGPDSNPDVAVGTDGRVWGAWCRTDSDYPNDEDIVMSVRDVTTSVDFWGLSGSVEGTQVVLAWNVAGVYAEGGFHVWRAEWAAGADQPPEGITESATRLTASPVSGCSGCRYVDAAVEGGHTYAYWLKSAADQSVFGPVVVDVPLSDAGAGRVSMRLRPNPTAGGLWFDVWGTGTRGGTLTIYTAGGRLVRRLPVAERPDAGTTGRVTLYWDGTASDGARLPSGVYYVTLDVGGGVIGSSRGRVVIMQ
jgi:hypothetical protein